MLVDAAAKLCLERGYENTTVDQIAAAAEVSPRTFSRYFPTKDSVVVGVLDGLTDATAAELAEIPLSVPPLVAIGRAHLIDLRRVADGAEPGLSINHLVLMVNVISTASVLRAAAISMRPVGFAENTAARLGTDVKDGRVALVLAVWTAIVGVAWGRLVLEPQDFTRCPQIMAERIERVLDQYDDIADAHTGWGIPSTS